MYNVIGTGKGGRDMKLTERKEMILAAIVEQYIKTGEPVGSKGLLNTLSISVSSATIRNEMSELDEMGYLIQPHTSAGRIPSQAGYRYYIDNLMNRLELSDEEKEAIASDLRREAGDPNKLLEKASEILARKTDCAALTTSPTDELASVKRIEIVPIGGRLAMIVLMTSTGIIKSTVCRTDTEITDEMLDLFRNIVSERFIGEPVSEIGTVMIQTLVASLGMNALSMSPMFVSLADIAKQAVQAEVHLEGEQNLLHHHELHNSVFGLMQFLDEDEKLSRALDSSRNALNVLIGTENMFTPLENSSMIVARYNIRGNDGGAIGIIGPTRLNYAKLIPSVEYLTQVVSKLLTDSFEG